MSTDQDYTDDFDITVKPAFKYKGKFRLLDVRRSAFDEVRKWDNEQLRTLLKEVKEIGKQNAPRYFKKSDKMKQLFELEKADYYTWADQFINIQRAIEVEILYRVRTDAW